MALVIAGYRYGEGGYYDESDGSGPYCIDSSGRRVLQTNPGLFTDLNGPSTRLRVDVGQTGFFAGREFRSFYEFNIPSGQSVYLKFVAPVNFILFEQSLTVDAGSIRFRAITGATETVAFTTPLPVIGKNRMTERPQPYYTAVGTGFVGGTITGGTVVEVARVVAANATAQQQTVGAGQQSERGLPPGTYYLQFENLAAGAATGVYYLFWEERP